MFDIGFWELAIIGVIALLVLGPERLPRVARTAGMYLGKARRTWSSVRREIERELAAEDLKRSLEEPMKAARDLKDELGQAVAGTTSPASGAQSAASDTASPADGSAPSKQESTSENHSGDANSASSTSGTEAPVESVDRGPAI